MNPRPAVLLLACAPLAVYLVLTLAHVNEDIALSAFWAVMAVAHAAGLSKQPASICLYLSITLMFMYVENRAGNKLAYAVFYGLHLVGLLVYLFYSRIDKWFKKLWGKLRSAGLTMINELSFRRQVKEATS